MMNSWSPTPAADPTDFTNPERNEFRWKYRDGDIIAVHAKGAERDYPGGGLRSSSSDMQVDGNGLSE